MKYIVTYVIIMLMFLQNISINVQHIIVFSI